MREITFDESKKIMVKTLESIDKCCRDNNIMYSLCWGTMIGAIRHHGFIPWDDDIDIMMPRKDYNRFLEIYNDPEYGVYTPKADKNCIQIITKIYNRKTCAFYFNHPKSFFGVWVSIFPYDNAPDENLKQWEKRRDFWLKLYHIKTTRFFTTNSLKKRLGKVFLKTLIYPFSSFWINNKLEACLTKYNNHQTKNICIWPGIPYNEFRYFPKELLDECIDVQFENLETRIIKRYDEFMRLRYGDYMKLPPESERIPKHNYKAYYIE